MTHNIVVFQPALHRILSIKQILLQPESVQDHPQNLMLICRFFSLFHYVVKDNIAAIECRVYLLAMAYSLRQHFITFKSVAL